MEFKFTAEQEAFRAEVRSFIGQNWDSPPAPGFGGGDYDADRAYRKKLGDRGWLTLAWPKEYGGMGASHMEQLIFREESAYAGAPGAGGQGIGMVGPCLMVHGTEDQKKRFLPDIANDEVEWCQGFSEPGSGSDLASLQTRAVKDGDEYVINGQKIWTSSAHHADWIHMLARTDPDAPKHRGITYFLVDMKTPGIEYRPLINMANQHSLNETFFTDVRVPASQVVGEVNRGWYVATTTLDFERSGVGASAEARRNLEYLGAYASEAPGPDGGRLIDDTAVRNRFADYWINAEAARWLSYRVTWMQSQGLVPNYESSMSKMFGAELSQNVYNWGVNLLGLNGTRIDQDDPQAFHQASVGTGYMTSLAMSIAGGTNEIQRNIIATRGLGLPRD